MASSGQSSEIPRLVSLIKTLTIPQLKDLLRNEGLPLIWSESGPPNLERLCQSEGNSIRYDALKKRIQQAGVPGSLTFQTTPNPQYRSPQISQQTSAQVRNALGGSMSPRTNSSGLASFKESPFFSVITPLTKPIECQVRESTRDNVEFKVYLSPQHVIDMEKDPNLRVMIYCAADSGLTPFTKSDISFPHQVELKANLDEVKANLRGLKNRPGTTQPADVTDYLRKKPNYPNKVVMTYALTQKKFFVLANLVRRHPVEELVAQLTSRRLISKEQVIREMKNRAEDSDIVATSSIMSLKCPLSTLRIKVPCRSVVCTHNQCFDASSFLELQKQAPTWTCPVCSKATSFESLQVDQYVDDILKATPSGVDQVVVEPNEEGDDDLVEISEPGMVPVKQEALPSSLLLERTPAQSREASTPTSAARFSSKKRPVAQVIDLTGSDEEDESPAPPRKRPITSFHPSQQGMPIAGSPLSHRPYGHTSH
ncbi:transcriptional regulator family: Zinc finger MIZ-type [Penicillium chermesinum]|uniref:Transcriptional regulator family: Zinc finger MIZ-type n=1 Tax=Penicillium chermesinum TaxID=63820 RepID=A0A9W9TZ35_9EURO|nr:transcriptional regulator family: Zinc finger MIZ-type [Penicillium chermesinum]KAJ5246939.1 transcriptional regulator family: Zinc finger MIZ-type [Penicillium chermesinum]